MTFKTFTALAVIGVALSGCASIVEGTTQIVAITSSPVDGAKCVLSSEQGTYYVTTPGNTTVHKSRHDLNVVCTKDGYEDGHGILASHFNGATAGNVLIGGLVGITIDAATGANYNFAESLDVPMLPMGSTPAASAPMPSMPGPATPPTPADAPPKPASSH